MGDCVWRDGRRREKGAEIKDQQSLELIPQQPIASKAIEKKRQEDQDISGLNASVGEEGQM